MAVIMYIQTVALLITSQLCTILNPTASATYRLSSHSGSYKLFRSAAFTSGLGNNKKLNPLHDNRVSITNVVTSSVLYCLHRNTTMNWFKVDYISATTDLVQCFHPQPLQEAILTNNRWTLPPHIGWNNVLRVTALPQKAIQGLESNAKSHSTNTNTDVNDNNNGNINVNDSGNDSRSNKDITHFTNGSATSRNLLHDGNSSFNLQTGCQLNYGSISRMPSLSTCVLHQDGDNNTKIQALTLLPRCDTQKHIVLSTHVCSYSALATRIAYHKAAWLLAKCNYVLTMLTIPCVLQPNAHNKLTGQGVHNKQSVYVFSVVNVLWMIWRLQETLHWDTMWQHHVPYICVATNTIRYLVEGVALFLFACTSLERYQVITSSLFTFVNRKRVKLVAVASIVGIATGLICSLLNIVALYMVASSSVLLKTCIISHSMSTTLMPLIVAKVVSLVALYLVPCSIMATANCAMIYSVRRRTRQNLGRCYSKKQRNSSKKTTLISSFLVFSSVFMVCCVSKPLYEVSTAITIWLGGSTDANQGSVLLDAITWNLTTIAYTINTVLGLRYSKL